jgi:outer membrane lipoprotein-sorting protein
MRLFRFASLLVVLSLALAACAPNELTAEQIMQRMQEARDKLQTAYTVADISLQSPERNGSFTVESWAKKTNQTDAAGQPITKLRAKVLAASNDQGGPDLTGTEFVNDGETFWLYNPAENKVVTGKLSELKNGDVGAQDPAAQMMRMQEVLQQIIDGSNVTIENESEAVAGRDTRKIKLTPKPETQQQLQLGSIIDTNLWIDKATDLPVKALIDAKDLGRVEATATTLDLNKNVADNVFTFTAPAGAEVINAAELAAKARPQVTTLADARTQLSFNVLSPTSLPEGVQLDEVQVLNMRGETLVQNFSGPVTFSVVQGKGELPGSDQAPVGAQAQQVTVRGQQATLITGGGGAEQGSLLRWQENGVTVVVAGTLSAEQATAIAESLQ